MSFAVTVASPMTRSAVEVGLSTPACTLADADSCFPEYIAASTKVLCGLTSSTTSVPVTTAACSCSPSRGKSDTRTPETEYGVA